MGEVLFWCLKKCLGMKAYTPSVHHAWVKVYSRMLRTIIPVAVALELKGQSESQVQRFTMKNTLAFSTEPSLGINSDEIAEDNLESEKIRRAEPVNMY